MISGLYAIKDVKSSFWKPFTHVNDVTAHREFTNLVNSPNEQFMMMNYTDLELWKLGDYDDSNGVIVSNPVYLVSGVDVKKVID